MDNNIIIGETIAPEEDFDSEMHVTVDLLNVRVEPSEDGEILSTIKKGQSVYIINNDGIWSFVNVNGIYGWVMTKYLGD